MEVAGLRHGVRMCLTETYTAGCKTWSAPRLFAKLCTFSGGKRKGGLRLRLNGFSTARLRRSFAEPARGT